MNESTKGYNFGLTPVSGAQTVLDSEIFEQMAMSTDGSYQYSFTVTRYGKITICILLYTQYGVYEEYYANTQLSGNNIYSRVNTGDVFSRIWLNDAVCPWGLADYVSLGINFLIKSPETTTINYIMTADDTAYFNIGKKHSN